MKAIMEKNVRKIDSANFICLICEYKSKRSTHMLNHFESKHMQSGLEYNCDICFTTCPTKNALNVHKSRKHKNVFDC